MTLQNDGGAAKGSKKTDARRKDKDRGPQEGQDAEHPQRSTSNPLTTDQVNQGYLDIIQECKEMEASSDALPQRAYNAMLATLRTALTLSLDRGQTALSALSKKITQQAQQSAVQPQSQTWASIAGRTPPAPAPISVIVKITGKEEQEEVAKLTSAELVQKIKKVGVLGANHQANGQVRVYTNSLTAKKEMEDKDGWVTKLARSAKVSKQQYMVLVHDMPRDFQPEDQAELRKLQEQNSAQIPDFQVIKAVWLHKKWPEGKRSSSLVAWTSSAAQADQAIEKGLCWDYNMKTVEKHQSQYRILQCFKCQKYGHQSYSCPASSSVCSLCGGFHP